MSLLTIRDPDLHGYLVSPAIQRTIDWIGRQASDQMEPRFQMNCFTLLQSYRKGDPDSPNPEETIRRLSATCPSNLAERLLEAMSIYRAVGWMCLPQLLFLVNRLLQAELHLYTMLKEGKPYRDHLVHQTRVAALAHLLFATTMVSNQLGAPGTEPDDPLIEIPESLRWDRIRMKWRYSLEFQYLQSFALAMNIDCPDPAPTDSPWDRIVPAAALLAGLVHDLGYVHKSLGEVSEAVAADFRSFVFPPRANLDTELERMPLTMLYHRLISTPKQGQRYAMLGEFLTRSYRDLHSLVGPLWLLCNASCCLPESSNSHDDTYGFSLRLITPRDATRQTPQQRHFELTVQLAAMMAFAHDFGLKSESERALLCVREKSKGVDVVNLEDFPVCTLFTLADTIQEFGRPVRLTTTRPPAIRFDVPIVGVRLESTEAGQPSQGQGAGLNATIRRDLQTASLQWDGPSFQPGSSTCLHIAWCSRDSRNPPLLIPGDVRIRRRRSDFKEHLVGLGQSSFLERSELAPSVRLDGLPESVGKITERFGRIVGRLRSGRVSRTDGNLLRGNLEMLYRLITRGGAGGFTMNGLEKLIDGLPSGNSAELVNISSLCVVSYDPRELLPWAFHALVNR